MACYITSTPSTRRGSVHAGKSKVDEDAPPAADLSSPAGSAPACREVSLVLNLATNADGVEDPQPIFDYAATGACAAVDE